jgi:hypothetical protein
MTAMALNALQVNGPDADVQEEVVLQLTASNTQGRNAPVPLTDDLSGELWQGTIMVGTPPASYTGKSYCNCFVCLFSHRRDG